MTPINLKIEAFGPYVKAEIPFKENLGEGKIFLIHGATGAGKTTILDAICYALYGETSGKARDAKDMRSKGVDDKVLTRVEFTFALGDRTYTIKREINYSSKRKDEYQTHAELYCGEKIIETKERAIKTRITELLGFNAEQFRQVVMLPQGEFKKFLAADSAKRQEVLNVLFDSTIYQKIEDALKEKAKAALEVKKELETRKETLEQQLNGADSDSMAAVEEKLLVAQKKSADLKVIFDAAHAQLSEGKILTAKFADLQKKTSDVKAAQVQLAEIEKIFATAQAEYQSREAQDAQRKELDKKIHELEEIRAALENLTRKNSALKTAQSNLATAQEKFNACDAKAKQYEELLADLEAQKLKVADADAEFEKVKPILKQAKDKAKLLGEIARCEKSLAMEQEKFDVLEKNLTAAKIELERLQIVDNAARLVSKLKPGEPCPVCGSREHPAITQAAIPTVAELQSAEKNVDRLNKDYNQQIGTVKKISGELAAKKEQLAAFANTPDVLTAQNNFDAAQLKKAELARLQQRIDKGNAMIKENKNALNQADANKNAAANEVAKLEGAIAEAKKKIPDIYLTARESLAVDLNSAQKTFAELDDAWKVAQKTFHDVTNKKSARAATLAVAKKNIDALQNELQDRTPPDMDSLTEKAAAASENYNGAIREAASLETTLNTLKKYSAELAEVRKNLDKAIKISDMWRRLSDVANATGKGESDLKLSFQRYFLSSMFNEVVTEANNRLKKMSNGRYLFQMKDAGKRSNSTAGLNLEIFDENNGALRPVETLSGGESFLASLALALGLASVVRNKIGGIKLDTIFIDEGFGSLDSETLDFAISTIIQQSGGRLVGIISHVEDLKNQIPVRLEIKTTKAGSTAEFFGTR